MIFWKKLTRRFPDKEDYDRDDLISDLDSVLANCAEQFNPEMGFSFLTYAMPSLHNHLNYIQKWKLGRVKEMPISNFRPTDKDTRDIWGGFNQPDQMWEPAEDHSELMQEIYRIAKTHLTSKQLKVFMLKHPKAGKGISLTQQAKETGLAKETIAKKYRKALKTIYSVVKDRSKDYSFGLLVDQWDPSLEDSEK